MILFFAPKCNKKRPKISLRAFRSSRRLPIFTSRFQLTILGTSELNYCVRNGNRWDLTVIDTDRSDWLSITCLLYFVQCFLLQSNFSIVGNNVGLRIAISVVYPESTSPSCDWRTCLQNWIITANIFSLTLWVSSELWSSPRSISTHLLNGSLHLHIVPINLVVFKGSYLIESVGYLIFGSASRLDAFSVYPIRT